MPRHFLNFRRSAITKTSFRVASLGNVNYLLAKDQVASRFIDLTNVNASPSFCLMSDCIPKPDNYILSHWLIHRNG